MKSRTLLDASKSRAQASKESFLAVAVSKKLSTVDQDDLDIVAASLNDRPRKTLDYATPNEAFNSLLATLAGGSETQNGDGVRYGC